MSIGTSSSPRIGHAWERHPLMLAPTIGPGAGEARSGVAVSEEVNDMSMRCARLRGEEWTDVRERYELEDFMSPSWILHFGPRGVGQPSGARCHRQLWSTLLDGHSTPSMLRACNVDRRQCGPYMMRDCWHDRCGRRMSDASPVHLRAPEGVSARDFWCSAAVHSGWVRSLRM